MLPKSIWVRLTVSSVIGSMIIGLGFSCFAAGNVKQGKRNYAQYCTPCHGKEGKGDGTRMVVEKFDPAPRNHTDGNYMNKRTDIQLFKTIKEGGKAMNFSYIMPQWKHIIKDKEVWDIITFLRSIADPPYTGKPEEAAK